MNQRLDYDKKYHRSDLTTKIKQQKERITVGAKGCFIGSQWVAYAIKNDHKNDGDR